MRKDGATRRCPAWQAAALVLAAASQTGCYTYSAPEPVGPVPGRTFAFSLTDHGRAALADGVGAGTDHIEGVLVRNNDTSFTVSVARVVNIRGAVARWNGEVVSFPRQYVGSVRERQLSKTRTALAIGGTTAAVVALIATRGFGVVGNDPDREPGEEPPGGTTSRMWPLTSLINLLRSRSP
ncbi:MAG: hypothetical protein ACRDFT_04360 [bacterium]